MLPIGRALAALAVLAGVVLSGDVLAGAVGAPGRAAQRPIRVVVTTSILGDIVAATFGDLVGPTAEVAVVMPAGTDPHTFQPSTRQAEAMHDADLLVVNGRHLETSLIDLIASAEADGTPVFVMADHVSPPDSTGSSVPTTNAPADAPADPHIWMDPVGMIGAVRALGGQLVSLGVPATEVDPRVAAYVDQLSALDREITSILAPIPAEHRLLVTNHDNLGLFAHRYGFEVIGAVVPSMSTGAEPSAASLEALATLISTHGVPAIFAEHTASARLAEALAADVAGGGGEVAVVELYTDSLAEPGGDAGPDGLPGPDTYLGMMRTDARLIADALAHGWTSS